MHNHYSKMFLYDRADYSTSSPVVDNVLLNQSIKTLVAMIEQELRPQVSLKSIRPHDPIEVKHIPAPWQLLGTGNYAAVFTHPDYADLAVKIYAPDRPGFEDEAEVYRRIGIHPAFSQCFYARDNFLVLKCLEGITLYNCLHQGRRIPKQVILDIDQALDYARSRGLRPHDVHGKNVMIQQGRGLVVDISDFLRAGSGLAWDDLKTFYYWVYRPFLSPLRVRIPLALLDISRGVYRFLRVLLKRKA
ncbi:serine/threonine protein kinase [Leptothoe sp. ISB3NOV94-8A]|uniref:serine/threonine protein kinase n=1 Tax=Adonisia turfae TaxID=2950184 RepID=UPI0020299A71|nr:serine/threonine protein kinase [Adonisia turfae]